MKHAIDIPFDWKNNVAEHLLIEPNIALMAENFTSTDERAWTCSEVEGWLEANGLRKQADGQWLGSYDDIRWLVDPSEIRRAQPVITSSFLPQWLRN